MLDVLKKLCSLPGVSGNETAVREFIIEQIAPHCEYSIDALGNILAVKRGVNRAKKRVLLCAHMDEVGFIVTRVEESGLLHFSTVGGIDTRVIMGARVRVGARGVPGVIATKPVHLLSGDEKGATPQLDSLYIDIGASDEGEALAAVSPGDTARFDTGYAPFGDGLIKARALDDRAGCALLIELIKQDAPYDLHIAFTVQEEVGLRGAKTAAYTADPHFALVLEATTAADIPGVEGARRVCALRQGPVVSFTDGRTIYDRALYDLAFERADALSLPIQPRTAVAGGNDAGAIHQSRTGVRTLAVSLPCRYLHSPNCVIAQSDLAAMLPLVQDISGILASGSI